MTERFRYCHPDEAGWFLRRLRDAEIDEDCILLENLFSSARIAACDESVFLDAEDQEVLALAIINKARPCVWSYFTIPRYRCNGYGYRLLVRCIERILEHQADSGLKVEIEPISDESVRHIQKLPAHLRERLEVHR
jgi:hypothetical protein